MKKNIEELKKDKQLEDSCTLFTSGSIKYRWNAASCYMKAVMGIDSDDDEMIQKSESTMSDITLKANQFKNRVDVKNRIHQMLYEDRDKDIENKIRREMLTDVMEGVVTEAASHYYINDDGDKVVPASLRGIAVRATDTIMKLQPDLAKSDNDNSATGTATITFNIKPQQKRDVEDGEQK